MQLRICRAGPERGCALKPYVHFISPCPPWSVCLDSDGVKSSITEQEFGQQRCSYRADGPGMRTVAENELHLDLNGLKSQLVQTAGTCGGQGPHGPQRHLTSRTAINLAWPASRHHVTPSQGFPSIIRSPGVPALRGFRSKAGEPILLFSQVVHSVRSPSVSEPQITHL